MTTGTELLAIGILILCNAFFVAAEIALVTVRKSRLQQLVEAGDARAMRVSRLIDRPQRLLAVIQTGITFVSFLAAAFAGASISESAADILRPVLGESAEAVALITVTVILSLVTIVFGELVPKTLALAHAERFALVFARPVDVIGRLLAPIVWLLTAITTVTTRPQTLCTSRATRSAPSWVTNWWAWAGWLTSRIGPSASASPRNGPASRRRA